MINELGCSLEVSEFELRLCYYVHFQIKTLRKGIELPYPPRSGFFYEDEIRFE